MNGDDEAYDDLRETFDYNDRDGNGKIDLEEFVGMLADLEADVSAAEARIGFETIDSDGDGAIEFDEFLDWWNEQ